MVGCDVFTISPFDCVSLVFLFSEEELLSPFELRSLFAAEISAMAGGGIGHFFADDNRLCLFEVSLGRMFYSSSGCFI